MALATPTTSTAFDPRVAPPWARDLVIYELNPRTFTSPDGIGDGGGSGTFAALEERLPYLADLGVNALWLAGYCAASEHFYGITSVYSCVDPSAFDPVLGDATSFRRMVEAAHGLGIRVVLDVISHGVVSDSPLVAGHPEFFAGSTWGMTDYDYTSPAFREWWADTWVRWASEYGVDGFRIDVDIADITIWDEIVTRLASLGKEVVVFPENGRYHFSQTDWFAHTDHVRESGHREYGGNEVGLAANQLSCHDNGWLGLPGNHYSIRGSRARMAYSGLLAARIPLFFAGEEFDARPDFLPSLRQGLFGTGGPGGWLYGSRLDWSQLDEPAHAAMHADVRDMLRLRRTYPHLLNGDPRGRVVDIVPNDGALTNVPYVIAVPGQDALVVLVNPTSADARTQFQLPLDLLGLRADGLVVRNAVDGADVPGTDGRLHVVVSADRQRRGGYLALHVTGTAA